MTALLIAALVTAPALSAPHVSAAVFSYYDSVFQDLALCVPDLFLVTYPGKSPVYLKHNPNEYSQAATAIKVRRVAGGHGNIAGNLRHETSHRDLQKKLTGYREWIHLYGNKAAKLTNESLDFRSSIGWGAILGTSNVGEYPNAVNQKEWAMKAFRTNKPYVLQKDGWFYEARPIGLNNVRCLSCHRDSRLGDAAGVLVVALRSDQTRK